MLRNARLSAVLLAMIGAQAALADITFFIEEPGDGSIRSGVGLVSGWAISDRGIESVEAFIDGQSMGPMPYGSIRGDVEDVFPDVPDSLYSGWGMKWAYALNEPGEHTLRVVVTEQGGATASKEVVFYVTGFHSAFISNPADVRTADALLESPVDGRIHVYGAEIEGEPADLELVWDTASQQFLIEHVEYAGEPRTNQAPTVQAGANIETETGMQVTVSGEGSDPDGWITSRTWSQLSGPAVSLVNADQWTVSFNAPQSSGEVRLQLKVTDNDGLSASDDVVIQVVEPVVENSRPTANAGFDMTVTAGDPVSITGNGSDSDGEIVSWNWSRVAGLAVTLQSADSRTVEFTAPQSDGYVRLRLRVTDDDGATDYDDVVVYFELPEPENSAPTANAGADITVETGDEVVILGNGEDSDGEITGWSWTRVLGPAVTLSGAGTREVSFRAPDSVATIRLRLQVTDNDGATGTDEVTVTVVEPGEPDNTTGSTVQSMLAVINEARGTARDCADGNGEYPAQPALAWSSSLAEIAMIHSMDMAREGYFQHDSLDKSWVTRVSPYWNGSRIGENIAASSHNRTDEQVVQLWLDSPPHCAAIMDSRFTHAGIGSGQDADNGFDFHYFWTLDFGG